MKGKDLRDMSKTFELVVAVLTSAAITAKALADLIDFVANTDEDEED